MKQRRSLMRRMEQGEVGNENGGWTGPSSSPTPSDRDRKSSNCYFKRGRHAREECRDDDDNDDDDDEEEEWEDENEEEVEEKRLLSRNEPGDKDWCADFAVHLRRAAIMIERLPVDLSTARQLCGKGEGGGGGGDKREEREGRRDHEQGKSKTTREGAVSVVTSSMTGQHQDLVTARTVIKREQELCQSFNAVLTFCSVCSELCAVFAALGAELEIAVQKERTRKNL